MNKPFATSDSIVWVPQDTGKLNLSPALDFGTLDSFASIDCPISRIGQCYDAIGEWLEPFKSDRDFLMLIGDPVLISLCIAWLSRTRDRVQLLKWDRQERRYIPFVLKFH